MIRLTAHFSGHVQGVAFRYTTVEIAQRHAVAGYVQNLRDGRVRLVAEGDGEAVDQFVKEVASRMSRYISEQAEERGEGNGEFGPARPGAFGIRY